MFVYIDDGFGPALPSLSLDLARKKQNLLKTVDSMWLYYRFWKVSLATTKRTYLAGLTY